VTHDHELTELSAERSISRSEPSQVWSASRNCRPRFLEKSRLVLCHFDDETRPQAAFELLSREGKVVHAFQPKTDALTLKVSEDEKWLLLSLPRGKAILWDLETQKVSREFQVEGEIQDLAVSSGENPRIGILGHSVNTGQLIYSFRRNQNRETSKVPASHPFEDLEMDPDGERLYLYSNSPHGQKISALDPDGLQEKWNFHEPRYADYSSGIQLFRQEKEKAVLLGVESLQDGVRQSRLIVLSSRDGSTQARLHLPTEQGAYLYHSTPDAERGRLVVATDDGMLRAYRLRLKP
jgi:WD40 repeat protein